MKIFKRKFMIRSLAVILSLGFVWAMLSLYVQFVGPEERVSFGDKTAARQALVVFDPDPFYNFDEQICHRFAEAMSEEDWHVTVATVAAARKIETRYDCYVFCANTYNWAPDWAVSQYIRKHQYLNNCPVVAIVLGGGNTKRAENVLKAKLQAKQARLLTSQSLWLLRPNDETQNDRSNLNVALDKATALGKQTAQQLN